MWDLPGLGIKPIESALAGRFLSNVPPEVQMFPLSNKTGLRSGATQGAVFLPQHPQLWLKDGVPPALGHSTNWKARGLQLAENTYQESPTLVFCKQIFFSPGVGVDGKIHLRNLSTLFLL